MASRNWRAISSVMSFSSVPAAPALPWSSPPCPGSMTARRTAGPVENSGSRSVRAGSGSAGAGVASRAGGGSGAVRRATRSIRSVAPLPGPDSRDTSYESTSGPRSSVTPAAPAARPKRVASPPRRSGVPSRSMASTSKLTASRPPSDSTVCAAAGVTSRLSRPRSGPARYAADTRGTRTSPTSSSLLPARNSSGCPETWPSARVSRSSGTSQRPPSRRGAARSDTRRPSTEAICCPGVMINVPPPPAADRVPARESSRMSSRSRRARSSSASISVPSAATTAIRSRPAGEITVMASESAWARAGPAPAAKASARASSVA